MLPIALASSCGGDSEVTHSDLAEVVETDSISADSLPTLESGPFYQVPGKVAESECFPYPDEAYVEMLEQGTAHELSGMQNPLYGYLVHHFDSLEAKQYKQMEDEWDMGVYDFEQRFSNGIIYAEYFGGEGGAVATIYTNCSQKAGIYSTLNAIVNRKSLNSDWEYDGVWNDDSTEYSPDGAGCYYELIKNDSTQFYHISNYCGC